MAPNTRNDNRLANKIATLQLRLTPLVPLPVGPPHPAFPKTLMAFHLLTEEELDSIAHYYHQSTPCQWTQQYPAPMNWDRDFLAKPPGSTTTTAIDRFSDGNGEEKKREGDELPDAGDIWLDDLMGIVEELQQQQKKHRETGRPLLRSQRGEGGGDEDDANDADVDNDDDRPHHQNSDEHHHRRRRNPYAHLSDRERIRIKRRKVGKFIGLIGMETPVEEIAGRIHADLERAMEENRAELRRHEEGMLRRRKMA